MKKIFILSVIMGAALTMKATDGPVATLVHDGEITAYTGYMAFHEANEHAQDGDMIQLSPGKFQAPGNSLKTGLKVKGAGMGTGTADEERATYIDNELPIVPYSDAMFVLEGLCFNDGVLIHASQGYDNFARNVAISKCSMEYLNIGFNQDKPSNVAVSDCKIAKCISTETQAAVVNCVIGELSSSGASYSNCVIYDFYIADHGWQTNQMVVDTNFDNCIFLNTTAKGGAETLNMTKHYLGNAYYNCLAVGAFDDIFSYPQYQSRCWIVASAADVFAEYTSNYSPIVALTLTAAAQKDYVGTDGTQVGIYGGFKPFNNVSEILPVATITVDRNTNPAGHLKVAASIE